MASYIAPRCVKCKQLLTIVHLMQFSMGRNVFIASICFPCSEYYTGWTGEDNHIYATEYNAWKMFTEESEHEQALMSPAIFGTHIPYESD